jgi:predicted AlkP superfamily phosphohydrolase/phosphomutase
MKNAHLSTEPRAIARLAVAALVAVAAIACASCSRGKPEPPAQRSETHGAPDASGRAVYIVAIDGATWDVFDPLMAEGRLPHLARLAGEGARAVLRSMEPTASAIIWTTMATGRTPDEHGIQGFVVRTASGNQVPVTSTLRKTKALWNIASEAGIEVGFIGWWVTWPAEEVRGFMCSDYTWPVKKNEQGFATGEDTTQARSFRTYPESLMRELDPLLLTESRLSKEALDSLGILAIPPVQGNAVREVFLKDLSHIAISRHLLSRHSPRLFAVYFDGWDAFCHIFWDRYRGYRAARSGAAAPPEQWAKGEAMDDHLARIDSYLGELMARARPDDVVLVVSDHGYGDNPGGKPIQRADGGWINPPHWHTLDGIFAAWGGPIERAAQIDSVAILDVAPIVLRLLDLPVGEDMDGRVPAGLFRAEAAIESRTIATYDSVGRGDDVVASPFDEEVIERLRALGYLD